jgi:hypothetical protein
MSSTKKPQKNMKMINNVGASAIADGMDGIDAPTAI